MLARSRPFRIALPWRVGKALGDARRTVNTASYAISDALRNRRALRQAPQLVGKVSIVIPTLSKGKHLSHLESLRRLLTVYLPAQTYSDYEALVYCDGPNPAVRELVHALNDARVRVLETPDTLGLWGHPQTRAAIGLATGKFFLRMNDDNKPYARYLETLVHGFDDGADLVYARVLFKGAARYAYADFLARSFLIPGDREGVLKNGNIDCMCYAVRTDVAKRHAESWGDMYAADWRFVQALLTAGVRARFVDTLVGEKY